MTHPTEGGTKAGDYHIWIEDKESGKVVFDPTFKEHKLLAKFHGLDRAKPVYKEWGNRNHWFRETHLLEMMTLTPISKTLIAAEYATPQFNRCGQNAIAWFVNHGDSRKHRLVIGSKGFQKKNGQGSWWEWG